MESNKPKTPLPQGRPTGPRSPASGQGPQNAPQGGPGGPPGNAGSADDSPALQALAKSPYAGAIAQAESDNGIPQNLLGRLLWQESRLNPNPPGSNDGGSAAGIAQFHAPAAQDAGISWPEGALDPDQAIPAAGRYLRMMYDQTGSWSDAVGAYRQGAGSLNESGPDSATQAYVSDILSDVPAADDPNA